MANNGKSDKEPGYLRGGAGFDAVIGNPPWVSFSGRQAEREAGRRVSAFGSGFESFRGWQNTASLFLELGAKILKPGGRMGMIAPLSISHQKMYEPTREALQRELYLEELIECGEKSFKGVTEPSAIYIMEKRGRKRAIAERRVNADTNIIKISEWKRQREARNVRELLERLDKGCPKPPLGSFKDIGVHTGNASKELIYDEKPSSESAAPVIEGKDIQPFIIRAPSKWLITEPKLGKDKYFRIMPRERYEKADLLIRQTAHFPIAAPNNYAAYFRNSALAYFHNIQQIQSPFIVCAILNSWLIRFFFQEHFPDVTQKSFPQIKIYQLNSIPLPPAPIDTKSGLAVLRKVKEFITAEIVNRPRIVIELNCLVALFYRLSDAELETIIQRIPEAAEHNIIEHYRRLIETFGNLNPNTQK
ncbi:MAG: hypothetical protein Kow0090_03280 [Myxococcota bacterium]